MKQLIPSGDRILVIPLDKESMSQGIFIPETAIEEQVLGVISMVGDSAKFAVGDTVIYGIYAGIPIEIEGRLFTVMRSEEVLGVIVDVQTP